MGAQGGVRGEGGLGLVTGHYPGARNNEKCQRRVGGSEKAKHLKDTGETKIGGEVLGGGTVEEKTSKSRRGGKNQRKNRAVD